MLSDFQISIVKTPGRHPTESILLETEPTSADKCVTVVHGGPHGISTTAFYPAITALALQGCMFRCISLLIPQAIYSVTIAQSALLWLITPVLLDSVKCTLKSFGDNAEHSTSKTVCNPSSTFANSEDYGRQNQMHSSYKAGVTEALSQPTVRAPLLVRTSLLISTFDNSDRKIPRFFYGSRRAQPCHLIW
jgi:hypothetical protein